MEKITKNTSLGVRLTNTLVKFGDNRLIYRQGNPAIIGQSPFEFFLCLWKIFTEFW